VFLEQVRGEIAVMHVVTAILLHNIDMDIGTYYSDLSTC